VGSSTSGPFVPSPSSLLILIEMPVCRNEYIALPSENGMED
jgi:hypothetical protein